MSGRAISRSATGFLARPALAFLAGPLTAQSPEARIEAAKRAGRKVAFTLSDSFCIARHRDGFNQLIDEGVREDAVAVVEGEGPQCGTMEKHETLLDERVDLGLRRTVLRHLADLADDFPLLRSLVDRRRGGVVEGSVGAEREDDGSLYGPRSDHRARPRTGH